MAHGADPLDECGLGLQEVEGVVAVGRDRHGGLLSTKLDSKVEVCH